MTMKGGDKMKGMKPLTSNKESIERKFTKAFCATLPTEKELSAVSKAFCATLPGELDPAEITKAFCATLPSEADAQKKMRATLEPVTRELDQK